MKPTKEIIGLRIISISDGTQVGVVKDFVLSPMEKTLEFMIVDQPADYFGAKVIAFKDILGLGEFAVTIPDLSVIQDVAQNTEAQNLLKQGTYVIGTKVLTKKGQLIGEVKEVLIDEENGKIAACLFESAEGQMHEIPASQVITLGKELLIIEGTPLGSAERDVHAMKLQSENQMELPYELATEDPEAIPEFMKETDPTPESETGFNLFEQRQLQYFVGKTVEKDIILDNADILRAGERITPDLVRHITSRSTLMEITSHLQKN